MQSDLLDTVIGVVFVWFLLSLVLSTVGEGIAWLTRARAKHLWRGIGRLIDPLSVRVRGAPDLRPKTPKADQRLARPTDSTLRRRYVETGLPGREAPPGTTEVRAETQRLYTYLMPHLLEVARPGRLSKVTRLASESFSEALVVAARRVTRAQLLQEAEAAGWNDDGKQLLQSLPNGKVAVDEVAALADTSDYRSARPELIALYENAKSRLTVDDLVDDVTERFTKNPELANAVRRAAAAVGANERAAAVKKVIESWFEREMDQLSAFYRRQSRKILGFLAIPLVVFCHADAIEIFDNLRRDAALREATVNAAVGGSTLDDAIRTTCEPATTRSATTTTTPATTTTVDPADAAAERFRCASDILDRAAEFRVGLAVKDIIESSGKKGEDARFELRDVPPYLGDALGGWGWAGRSLTLLALLFGAQFWFDVLRRLTGLRAALKRVSTPPQVDG